jgi:hypothetical protein
MVTVFVFRSGAVENCDIASSGSDRPPDEATWRHNITLKFQ